MASGRWTSDVSNQDEDDAFIKGLESSPARPPKPRRKSIEEEGSFREPIQEDD